MASTDIENSPTYTWLERLLIWFLIPFVFTGVLIGVLLSVFDYDVTGSLLKAANKIPVVGNIIPDPKTKSGVRATSETETPVKSVTPDDMQIEELSSNLTIKDEQLKKSELLNQQKDQQIKDLQSKITSAEEASKTKAITDEEYAARVQQLASVYAKMTPSKAAPIMENLTLQESVLVLNAMKTDERVKILEKMDPKKAADVSIMLKDVQPAKDKQIAALQERLKLNESESGAKTSITKEDLAQTFGSMTPESSAAVILEMQKNTPDKALAILAAMDSGSRSRLLTALTKLSKETAASISAKLAQ